MADSWKTSRTRQAQHAAVKADRKIHQTGPWAEDGSLRLPDWLEGAPPMPELWPVEYFWMQAGRAVLAGQ